MAQVSLTFVAETWPVYDAINTVMVIHERLAKRHGDAFRSLDRRIDAFMNKGFNENQIGHVDLEPLLFVLTPPRELTEIVAEGRRLGVI